MECFRSVFETGKHTGVSSNQHARQRLESCGHIIDKCVLLYSFLPYILEVDFKSLANCQILTRLAFSINVKSSRFVLVELPINMWELLITQDVDADFSHCVSVVITNLGNSFCWDKTNRQYLILSSLKKADGSNISIDTLVQNSQCWSLCFLKVLWVVKEPIFWWKMFVKYLTIILTLGVTMVHIISRLVKTCSSHPESCSAPF